MAASPLVAQHGLLAQAAVCESSRSLLAQGIQGDAGSSRSLLAQGIQGEAGVNRGGQPAAAGHSSPGAGGEEEADVTGGW